MVFTPQLSLAQTQNLWFSPAKRRCLTRLNLAIVMIVKEVTEDGGAEGQVHLALASAEDRPITIDLQRQPERMHCRLGGTKGQHISPSRYQVKQCRSPILAHRAIIKRRKATLRTTTTARITGAISLGQMPPALQSMFLSLIDQGGETVDGGGDKKPIPDCSCGALTVICREDSYQFLYNM